MVRPEGNLAMPKTPPEGEGWVLVFESSDQRVYRRGEEEWVEWVNQSATPARLEDLEGRVTDLEGGGE